MGLPLRNEYRISRSSFNPSTGTLSVNLFENGEWAPWNSNTWKNPLRWTPDINEAERFVEFDAKQNGYTKATPIVLERATPALPSTTTAPTRRQAAPRATMAA